MGISYGLKPIKPWKGQAPDNPTLEKAYQSSRKGKLNYKQIQGLAKQLDWSERRIERWIRMRRMMDRPSTLVKFSESGWRLTYYAFAFLYGLWTLWDKPYLWDINYCWYNFPFQVSHCCSFSVTTTNFCQNIQFIIYFFFTRHSPMMFGGITWYHWAVTGPSSSLFLLILNEKIFGKCASIT